MSVRHARWLPIVAVLVGGCAPIPRPSVLDELDHVRAGAAATEAKRYAPDAFAHAEKLRREANAALEGDDLAGAQMLGEQAIAAHAHAHALARVARAESSESEAKASLFTSQASLATLEGDQTRVAAEIDALDMRIKVTRDAQPIIPSGKADAEREKARLAAAKSLALQARMLCGAAHLLLTPAEPGTAPAGAAELGTQLDEATAALKKFDADLAGSGGAAAPARPLPTPVDQASRVRASCLAVLTAARRAATPVTRAPGIGDALLTDLSAAGTWSPGRDDRGIVITLRGLFAGAGVTPAGEARLRDLARVAAAHPSFPVAVVVHTDRDVSAREEPAWTARTEAIVRILRSAQPAGASLPASRVEPFLAGAAAPVVDPAGNERARNARVEIVFVTPEVI